MGHLLLQHTIQAATGIPEDVVVNTFHFETVAAPTDFDIDNAMLRVQDFWNTIYPGNPTGTAVCSLVSLFMATPGRTIRAYDMAQPMPRVPVGEIVYAGLNVGAAPAPRESAIVLSYRGAPAAGVIPARNRGRIYIGPAAQGDAGDPDRFVAVSGGDLRPTLVAREVLGRAAAALAAPPANPLVSTEQWSVFSRVDNALRPIVGGFVDDALDTQRRRGARATTRTNWVSA